MTMSISSAPFSMAFLASNALSSEVLAPKGKPITVHTFTSESKAMIDAGATRLGVSAGVAIMEGLTSNDSY